MILGARLSRAGLGLTFAVATIALGADASPMLHERIADDPQDDIAMKVMLDGDLPAAIETPSGVVTAPDPRRPLSSTARPEEATAAKGSSPIDSRASGVFVPDRDTRRPGLLPYQEPFTPSTAPFKRVAAFDAVDSSYRLYVSHPELQPLAQELTAPQPSRGPADHEIVDGADDPFFADIVVPPTAGQPFRIPSVGPGARVLRARLGQGARDIGFKLLHDGADNWFIEANEGGRLVMEVSIPRAVFGGELGEPEPSDLSVPKLPSRLLTEAHRVAAAIGVDRTSSRQTVRRLVDYFRSFADSDERPTGKGSIYLDLALSKKGVCRHRAYAFMITALGLGIPTRMVTNEAHAWVEVYDGALWRRIDLGGAGGTLDAPRDESAVPYAAPPDLYRWPPGAQSGEDLGRREVGARPPPAKGPEGSSSAARGSPSAPESTPASPEGVAREPSSVSVASTAEPRDRHASRIVLESSDSDVRRGGPVHVRGQVESDGEPCGHVRVDVYLRDVKAGALVSAGSLATDEAGKFAGALIVPVSATSGDYDVMARTEGGTGCAQGVSQ
jgi:transglutaminase-like putative cysteine protease